MTLNDHIYHWQVDQIRQDKGVLIACNEEASWMLPWWWQYYQAHNSLPVTLVDLGLDLKMKKWAELRMHVVPLKLSFSVNAQDASQKEQIAKWEEIYGPNVLKVREAWFKKPFALLHTPYKHTLWLDMDCEVLSDLSCLFERYAQESLVLARETLEAHEQEKESLLPDEVVFNSGVLLYRHGDPTIVQWAKWCAQRCHEFLGDQQVLSRIIYEKKLAIEEFDPEDHWRLSYGIPMNAHIVHWAGNWGKSFIRMYGGWQLFKKQVLKGSFPGENCEKIFGNFKEKTGGI